MQDRRMEPLSEIEAMKSADEALLAVADEATRARVLRWLNDKHGFSHSTVGHNLPSNARPSQYAGQSAERSGEIPGIARVGENGQLQLTIRDLKASSKGDAAMRLVHVAVYAHQQLLGTGASRKDFINPTLRRYRLYDGNARVAIARHNGLLREGDVVTLDVHATKDAERYMAEICDPSAAGSWKPDSKGKKAAKARSKDK